MGEHVKLLIGSGVPSPVPRIEVLGLSEHVLVEQGGRCGEGILERGLLSMSSMPVPNRSPAGHLSPGRLH